MLFIPIFWIGWPVGLLILAGPILAYWKVRNSNVPEENRFYLTGASLAEAMAARRQSRASRSAVVEFSDRTGKPQPVPVKEDPLYPVHLLAEDLLGPAVSARASKLEMAVGAKGGVAYQTVDGIRYKREPIPPEAGMRLVDYLKRFAGLEVEDRRRRQTGDFMMRGPTGEVTVTLTTAGSSNGQSAKIEFNRAQTHIKPFDALGLLPQQLEALRVFEQPHERHGVILLGAPAGHGLATTAYSFIARHDAYTSNIKTLERDIELLLDGVDQTKFDPNNPAVDYATNLQSILRRDPDIVLITDAKDSETAVVAADPGLKGPLIYVPQALPAIADQLRDWLGRVGDPKQATKGLRAVVNQRLLRTLCPSCRQAFQPTVEQLKKLNLPANKIQQLYRASGKVQVKNKIENCPICGGTGYLGQTAAFEVMIIDDEVRKLLSSGDLKGARAHARRNKMIYLQEAAMRKAVDGMTSIEEVIRVTAPPKETAEGAAA
jgi:general secretion pathway protein E